MRRLRQFLTRNLGLKLLSLTAAVTLWAYTAMQPRMERGFNVAIEYVNVPPNLELNPDQAERVTMILHGPRDRLDELAESGLSAEVDFSNIYSSGEHTFNVQDLRMHLPLNVQFVRAVPSQLKLMLENRIRREVAVQPRFVGGFQPGYSLGSFTVDPPRLVIVGPESRMALVDQVTTDPIDLSGEIGSKRFQATAYVPDPYLRFEGPSSVTIEVNIRRRD
jgi:YbbR domain-containing protein